MVIVFNRTFFFGRKGIARAKERDPSSREIFNMFAYASLLAWCVCIVQCGTYPMRDRLLPRGNSMAAPERVLRQGSVRFTASPGPVFGFGLSSEAVVVLAGLIGVSRW
jgi:hypothetical protein